MKVLIIGGTGNISTAITRGLLARGADVTLFKRTTTTPVELKGVHLMTGNRSSEAALRAELGDSSDFDCVIDMVCYEPEDAESAARVFAGRTKQFIFCSTVDVYKKTAAAYPIREGAAEISAQPSFSYAWKKVECEKAFSAAHCRGDFALTIIRPAFTYNESWSPALHSFGGQTYHLDRLWKGLPFIMHGDGTSLCCAAHRDDVAAAFVNAVGNPVTYGEDYNTAGDEWMTHNHVWRTIARIMGAPEPDFVYIPTDLLGRLAPAQAEWCVESFRYNSVFDNSKAKRDLNFRYTVSFEEGVHRCLKRLSDDKAIEDCAKYPFYDRIVQLWRRHTAQLLEETRARPE